MSLIVDLFAGGGGASVGIEAALGRPVDIAVNHDETAIAVHRANHPATTHYATSVWDVRPIEVTRGERVELLWASPDCKHFSRAKGGVPRDQGIRSLAWVIVDWAREVRPQIIALENVQEFRTWGPLDEGGRPCKARAGQTYDEWTQALIRLGYVVEDRILDSSRYGAPTRRKRIFVVARCDRQEIRWPEPTHGPGRLPVLTAASCIDWSIPCRSIFDRTKPLAKATLRRVAEGIRRFVLGRAEPFIVPITHAGDSRVHLLSDPLRTITGANGGEFSLVAPTLIQTGHGERQGQSPRVPGLDVPIGTVVAGGAKRALVSAFLAKFYGTADGQPIDDPLHTATAKARFALVTAFLEEHNIRGPHLVAGRYAISDIGLRMLEPHELLRAQFGRFADRYDLSAAKSKAKKIRLIGNSVCPEVAEALIASNVGRVPAMERQGSLFA